MGARICFLVLCLLHMNGIYSQCPTGAPTVSDTCILAGETVTLNATGSTNSFAWYDAAVGGTHLGNGANFNPGALASTTTFYGATQEENYALEFDGVNDRVAIQNYSYGASGLTQLTVEAWVKTTSTSPMIIASFDRSEYWRLGIGSTGASSGRVSWSVNTSSGFLDMGGNIPVNDGQWHHVAAVYISGIARIYVDGVADVTSFTFFGSTWGSGATRFGFLGTGSEASVYNGPTGPGHYFDGEIDELRVWSDRRTAAEINANMNNCLLGTEPNLELYYKFNDGPGSSVVSDQVSNSDGNLIVMSPANDWLTRDAFYTCPSCESPRSPLTVTILNATPVSISSSTAPSCIGTEFTFNASSGFGSYTWNTGAAAQSINANVGGIYSVVAEQAGCYSADSVEIVGENGDAQTSGLFDGSNDFAAIDGMFYSSNSIDELSVEAWIRTTDAGNQIIASFDRSDYWRLGINGEGAGNGQVCWNLRTSAGILDFGSSSRVDDGNWHHVVGTYNAGLASIYIDGELDATATRGVTVGSGTTRYGFIGTGSEASSYNGSRGPNRYFDGEIEELRIWDKALTINEIRDNMCQNYVGLPDDLDAYFKFNEGTGVNLTSEISSVEARAFNINTTNFWENSGAPVGDNAENLYAAVLAGNSVSITNCNGDALTLSDLAGTATGIHIYTIEDDPSNNNGIDSLLVGNQYYGVFLVGDQATSYRTEISYNNNPLVTAENQFGLDILSRTDKTSASFSSEAAINDEINSILTIPNVSGRKELILDTRYYIWTGNSNMSWQTANNWSSISVPPVNANILIPDVTNQPRLDQNRVVGSVRLDPLASVDLDGNTLGLTGNFTANGDIDTDEGQISFSGSIPQTFTAGVTQTIDNMSTTNATNVNMAGRKVELINTLTVQNGVFETNDSLTLVSNASGTARIAEITGGGSITGEIEMQRYIDAGETYWRFFSSAVQGATIADYQGDFVTSGYVGSDFPSFPFTSVYTYIEGTGYAAVANANQVINQGQGVMVWSGDTITGTDPFVVDYRGVPNQGDINMPVTFSNTDGWNLLGNPYPSTINWDLVTGADRQNIANAIYILNPDTEQYATYINGASANGGSNLIPSQQAFWVGAIASNPVLTFRESIKSSVDQPFLKSGSPISSGVHILLSGFNKTDEAVIRHVDNATDGYDSEYDATKRFASWMEYPHVSVLNGDDVDYTVHSFDKAHQEWSLPIRTIVFQSGDYDITFSDLSELNVPCLMLEDTYTGQVYPIEESVPLTFTMSDTTYAPRFVLHIGKNYDIEPTEALCHGDFGQVLIGLDSLESGTFSLLSGTTTIETGSFAGGLQIDSLVAGHYSIAMTGLNNLCQSNQFDFEIVEPTELLVLSTVTPEMLGQDGAIELQIVGGTPGYTFAWSNGADSSAITGLTEGVYEVLVTDESNCSTSELFTLGSTLGIDNVEADETTKFVYFPEENRVSLSGELDLTYTLVDISGKMIAEYNVLNNAEQVDLELPNSMAKGTYVLTGINNSFTLIK